MTTATQDPSRIASPTQGRPHRFVGAMLIGAGVALLAVQAGVLASLWPAVPVVLLLVVGVAVVLEGLHGRWHSALVIGGLILTLLLSVSATAANSWNVTLAGVGDRRYTPDTVLDLQDRYQLGVGNLYIDLTDLVLPHGRTEVTANVGVGQLTVRVPEGVAVDVTAASETGDVDVFGVERGGVGVQNTLTTPGYDDAAERLTLDLHMGMGRIEVTR